MFNVRYSNGGLTMRKFAIAMLGLAMIVAAMPLGAQTNAGRIEGTVVDASGAAIPNARLSIVNNRTHAKVDVESDATGYFVFPILQPGVYSLTAEARGFNKATVANIELTLGLTLRQDVKLAVGAVTESVVVEASAVSVQTSEAT